MLTILSIFYFRWVDEKNYIDLSRPWYAKHLRFPFNYYYPGQYERDARFRLNACYEEASDDLATYVSNLNIHTVVSYSILFIDFP